MTEAESRAVPERGDVWDSLDGGAYVILRIGKLAIMGDAVVVYQKIAGSPKTNTVWVRTLSDFMERFKRHECDR